MLINWEEKRSSPRLSAKIPLRCQVRGLGGYESAVSEDISVGGVGFTNDRFISKDTYLNLEINLFSRIINAIGRVTHVNSLPHADKYHFGVQFLELDLNQKKYLSDYINMKLAA